MQSTRPIRLPYLPEWKALFSPKDRKEQRQNINHATRQFTFAFCGCCQATWKIHRKSTSNLLSNHGYHQNLPQQFKTREKEKHCVIKGDSILPGCVTAHNKIMQLLPQYPLTVAERCFSFYSKVNYCTKEKFSNWLLHKGIATRDSVKLRDQSPEKTAGFHDVSLLNIFIGLFFPRNA